MSKPLNISEVLDKEVLQAEAIRLLSKMSNSNAKMPLAQEALKVMVESMKVEKERDELQRELERYQKHFGFCKCGAPHLRADLSNYDKCPQCLDEERMEYQDEQIEMEDVEQDDEVGCPLF